MLIDPRGDAPLPAKPRRPRRLSVNWVLAAATVVTVVVFLVASALGGLVGYLMLLGGIWLFCTQLNRAFDRAGYVGGMRDHRQ
jgi:hypothetical protein